MSALKGRTLQERDGAIEGEPLASRLLGPRVGSEVYRPSGALKLRWRVWEVGPGNGRPSEPEATGSALTRRGARRAVTRAIRRLHHDDATHTETWAAGPASKHRRTHEAPEPIVDEDIAPADEPDAAEQVPTAVHRPTLDEPRERAPEQEDRLAGILTRVEELQRSIAAVVERLDASAEELEPHRSLAAPKAHAPDREPEADPAEHEPARRRLAQDA